MQLTFLKASVPLTKSYEKKPDGRVVGGSYPGVKDFTSQVEGVSSLEGFADCLKKHAVAGNCLLTSSLARPIVNESRASLSDPDEPREWIVLDLDSAEFNSPAEFVESILPSPFHNVSYIVQHSPSSGIKPGLRMHLFFMLDAEVPVKIISSWLKYMNLATKSLNNQITLSKSTMALSFPLDWVANNNGRIIYITPPECLGFDDPVSERVQLVAKDHELLSFNFASVSQAKLRSDYRAKVDELRTAIGLTNRKVADYYELGPNGEERVKKELTPNARITDFQEDNAYFMRCNLDGGDSWAYFYHRHRAEWLHNFKGEPALHLPSLDPDHYKNIAQPYMEKLLEKEQRPFVFRDELADSYYCGVRKGTEIIRQPLEIGSIQKIEDYFVDFGKTSPPQTIPTYQRLFRPELEGQWHPDERVFNVWRPSEYMLNAMYRSLPPDTIDRIIRHVTGSNDEAYEYFVNWLAYVFQTRRKTGTAWVLHGVPGTGKGVLYNYVIRPLFGHDYCQTKQVRDLRASFNGWMEHALFVNIDETNTEDAGREESSVIEALKMWITDPIISIEAKHQNARMARSYANFIFTSNEHGALPIQDGDRRFNVAPRQEQPIDLCADDIDRVGTELHHFAGYLSGYKVDVERATRPLDNDAKRSLRLAARTSVEQFVHSLADGDLAYFVEGLAEHTTEYEAKNTFKSAVDQWIDDARNERVSRVSTLQLRAAYVVMCSPRGDIKVNKFVSLMAKRGLPSQSFDDWNGWKVTWKLTSAQARSIKAHLKPVKTPQQIEDEVRAEIGTSPGEK